jgi:hypothetical protein
VEFNHRGNGEFLEQDLRNQLADKAGAFEVEWDLRDLAGRGSSPPLYPLKTYM